MASGKRFARLDQLLSSLGYATRSFAPGLLRSGVVTIEGEDKPKVSMRVDPARVRFNGEPLEHAHGLMVLMHKPVGYVCSHTETEGRNVYELLPERWLERTPQVVSVGRLDKDTSGALVLTDQLERVHQWTSPKRHVPKVYEVETSVEIPAGTVEKFASGTFLLSDDAKPCLPAELVILSPRQARITLHEGRYHQVRRMFADVGAPVIHLHRSHFGNLSLGDLKPGEYKLLPIDLQFPL